MNSVDLNGLASKLRADVKSSIEKKVFKICEEALMKSVMMTVYSGKPVMYDRTYELLRAVSIDNVNVGHSQATFEIIIDPNKMGLYPSTKDSWGKHQGLSGQDFREGLIVALDQGSSSPMYSHPAHGFFDKASDGLEIKIVKAMATDLKANGWDVTFI